MVAFLFAGRFVEKKGIAVLADAMRRLRASGDATPLICAGDGPLRPVLEALARDIPGVELAGWLSPADLAARMRSGAGVAGAERGRRRRRRRGTAQRGAGGDGAGLRGDRQRSGRHRRGGDRRSDRIAGAAGDAEALAAAMHRLSSDPGLAARSGGTPRFVAVGERLNAVRQSAALESILLDAVRRSLSPCGRRGFGTVPITSQFRQPIEFVAIQAEPAAEDRLVVLTQCRRGTAQRIRIGAFTERRPRFGSACR